MSAQHFEGRLSRIEGAYEQVADRLNSIDAGIAGLRHDVTERLGQIGHQFAQIGERFGQMDQRFTWGIGLIVTSWTTTILTVLLRHG